MNNNVFSYIRRILPRSSRSVFFFLSIIVWNSSFAQHPIGIFEDNRDIGNPKLAGSASYDEAYQIYSLAGAGDNIWFNKDEFHFLYKLMRNI